MLRGAAPTSSAWQAGVESGGEEGREKGCCPDAKEVNALAARSLHDALIPQHPLRMPPRARTCMGSWMRISR